MRAGVEEERASQMIGLRQEGTWTRWEEVMDRRISWAELWRAEPYCIKFLIQLVYGFLPRPFNLFCWGKVETSGCSLCQGRRTLEHILCSCPKALGDGHYCHDQVLKAVAKSICCHQPEQAFQGARSHFYKQENTCLPDQKLRQTSWEQRMIDS